MGGLVELQAQLQRLEREIEAASVARERALSLILDLMSVHALSIEDLADGPLPDMGAAAKGGPLQHVPAPPLAQRAGSEPNAPRDEPPAMKPRYPVGTFSLEPSQHARPFKPRPQPRLRVSVTSANRFLLAGRAPAGVTILGIVERGMQIGALARSDTGSYFQINGAIVQPLNASQVEAALRHAQTTRRPTRSPSSPGFRPRRG